MVPACVDIKVQLVLQFGVSRGLREILLAPVGRLYQRDVVSKFGPKPGPRCRDREARMISTQILTVRELVAAVQLVHELEQDVDVQDDLIQGI